MKENVKLVKELYNYQTAEPGEVRNKYRREYNRKIIVTKKITNG